MEEWITKMDIIGYVLMYENMRKIFLSTLGVFRKKGFETLVQAPIPIKLDIHRAFANHFHRRLQYIGDRSPNANLNGDKNIIHGKADEHNVDDDELLTSDFARMYRPFRNYPDMGGRKSQVSQPFSFSFHSLVPFFPV